MTSENKSSLTLREPLFWPKTALVREAAVEGMTHRAGFELDQVSAGTDIGEAHGETVGRYRQYEQLFLGAGRFLQRIGLPMHGRAADLGSGTGVAACIFSKFKAIEEVYAVEISAPFVTEVMPVVFREHHAEMAKIQRVVGDFSLLNLPDGALQVITEIDSFHHAENLETTLRECWRVLSPGGAIVAIDRGWPDNITQAQLDAKLDVQFPDYMKAKYNIPLEQSFTRRDWGEHEYTLRQWLAVFQKVGFDTAVWLQYHPPALNSLFLKLPTFKTSLELAALGYKLGGRRLWIYGFAPQRVTFLAIKA